MRATPPYPQRVFMQQRLVTEHARPARDLDLIDAGSRACQVDPLHDGGTQIATREPSSRRTQQ